MTGSNAEAMTGSMSNNESPDDSYLDDLPGYAKPNVNVETIGNSAAVYRQKIFVTLEPVEPIELQPLEKDMIRRAVNKKFKKIMCVGLSKSKVSDIIDVIIQEIDRNRLTSEQVKKLILETYGEFEEARCDWTEGADTLYHDLVNTGVVLSASLATLKHPGHYFNYLPEEKKEGLISNISKNAIKIANK